MPARPLATKALPANSLSTLSAAKLGLLLSLCLAALLASGAWADEGMPRSITVSGEAERRVAPDMATLQMNIVNQGMDPAVARADADATTNKALAIIRDAGVDSADTDSSGLNVTPQYRWNKSSQQQELTGYKVSRSVEVRLLDLSKLGELLTALSDAGVNKMQSPRMGVQDEEALHKQVLADAAINARERAQTIAETLGETLGGLLYANTENAPSPRPVMMERAMMAADSAVGGAPESYQAGHITYRVSLTASFSLQ